MGLRISAENTRIIREEIIGQGTEYVQKCLYPRDQTTQTNILKPYDLDEYDIIVEKETQEESDNSYEIIITKDKIQPVTELGNNLYEISIKKDEIRPELGSNLYELLTTSKVTKLIRKEIQPVKESESSLLLDNDICHEQNVEESSDSLQDKDILKSYDLDEYDIIVEKETQEELDNSYEIIITKDKIQPVTKLESSLLLDNDTCHVIEQTVQESFNSLQDKDSKILLDYSTRQVRKEITQESSASVEEENTIESSLQLDNDTCHVAEQTVQESFNSLQDKESSLLSSNHRCQVGKLWQTVLECFYPLQDIDSDIILDYSTRRVPEEIKPNTSGIEEKYTMYNRIRKVQYIIQYVRDIQMYHQGISQVTEQIMPESSQSVQKKVSSLLLDNDMCHVAEQIVQESFNSLQEKDTICYYYVFKKEKDTDSDILLDHSTRHVTEEIAQESSASVQEEYTIESSLLSSLLLHSNTCPVVEQTMQEYFNSLIDRGMICPNCGKRKKEEDLDSDVVLDHSTRWVPEENKPNILCVQEKYTMYNKIQNVSYTIQYIRVKSPRVYKKSLLWDHSYATNIRHAPYQIMQVSSEMVQKKESPMLLHQDTCQVTGQATPESSESVQKEGTVC